MAVAGSSLTTETRVNLHEFEEITMLWKVVLTTWWNDKTVKTFWLRKNADKFYEAGWKNLTYRYGVLYDRLNDTPGTSCHAYFQKGPFEGR